MITELQLSLLECVKPLIETIPETKKDISKFTDIPVSAINGLLKSSKPFSEIYVEKLGEYFNCGYELLERHEQDPIHTFKLTGGYTTFPVGKKQIVELYNQNSHGGDLAFAFEIVHSGGYKASHTRYVLLNTHYDLYTLMILKDQGDILDWLIQNNKLINFGGERVACPEMKQCLETHEFNLLQKPQLRRDLDEEFFQNKDLAFAQLQLSMVDR